MNRAALNHTDSEVLIALELGETRIGRASENCVVISADPLVSRKHTLIKCIGERSFLQDLQSRKT